MHSLPRRRGPPTFAAFSPQITAVTDEGQSCSTVADCFSKIAAGDDIDYEGVSGGIRFDAQGDPREARITLAQFDGADPAVVRTDELNLDELAQQEAQAAAVFTTRVQQFLAALGYYTGPIDGQESEELTIAIALFQADLGVPVTGVWDAATDEAAHAKYGSLTSALGGSVIGIQQLLTDLGFYSGPIDGVYSQETVDAVKAFQEALGVPQTGVIDAATLVAAFQAGIVVGTPTTTVPPTTTTPPTTAAPAPDTTSAPPPETTAAPAPETTLAPPTTLEPIAPPEPTEPTILEQLRADPRFSEFVKILETAGYTSDADVLGPITVFAPTNDALAAVDPATLDSLLNDPVLLEWVLAYHFVRGDVSLEALAGVTEIQSALGETIAVSVDANGIVLLDGVATIPPRIEARNGGIIPIAGVLVPETRPS